MDRAEPGLLLADADAARDARRWAEAAGAYAAYLRLRPDDRGAIVQHGHCLKEAGDPGAALALYRRAEAMDAEDPDIHLQIGHALKLLGRLGAAAEAYGQAVVLDPTGAAAWWEWRGLMAHQPPPLAKEVVLDLSDLVAWFGHRRAPSGIQRVQMEIAAAAGDAAGFCAMHPEEGEWRWLPAPLFRRLRHLAGSGADADEPVWRETLAALEEWRRRGTVLRPVAGMTLVTLGSAWWLPHYLTALRAARAAGVRYVPLLHDCGPLILPEMEGMEVRAEFGRWFSALPVLADGVIAVSQATATEYRRLMARHMPDWSAPPVRVVTPDGRAWQPEGEEEDQEASAPAPWTAPRAPLGLGALARLRAPAAPRGAPRGALSGRAHPDLPEGPYVLLVSSLEPRKNHTLALVAWRMLLDRRGVADTPRLVFAGRRVPEDEAVMAMLAKDPALAAHVTLLHELDDAALARLYRFSLFTLYPSRHEGWGLPVSESLLHGRVPLVSEIPALLESGRNGAVFFTPNSAEDLATAAEGLIADPERLAAIAARIPRHGGLRPWAEVAEALLAAATHLAGLERDPSPPLPLCQAIWLGHGGLAGPHAGVTRAESVLHGGGWHPMAPWGAWTKPGRATIRLPATFDSPARVAVSFRPPPGAQGTVRLTLTRVGTAPAMFEGRAEAVGEVALEVGAGAPELELVLESIPGTPLREADGKSLEVGVGVVSVALMRGEVPADRIVYLENRILVPAHPA
ncbi:glycosyltransferase [Roseomonas xinghualingensis]|uniref:glycosyltransferase n=1 Tax=Roseomonas xinghualingensis TaxID=2986475 RepID=UPI0021F10828|nr:glycosyltransferase [Roseomonas sp. SXEYE001]MCV4207768.1 glycosyltransferase [Roseomonas sp. SXEYE001]